MIKDKSKEILRASDDVFRYGCEEMTILLPEQTLKTAAAVAERTRKDIEAAAIEHRGSARGVLTISCGVSAFDKDCTDTGWDAFIKKAEDALSAAGSAGRDRVMSSDPH
ncbi:MAG TPA: diguanylate cyclase [Thermodesulfovibrionales bacterium]|nr:diguanylate cyclase [Thermodesulfovibrionales bacterium]